MSEELKPISAEARKLAKAGWKLLRKTKLRSDWESPYDGRIYSQSYAAEYEIQLACRKRLALEQNGWITKG